MLLNYLINEGGSSGCSCLQHSARNKNITKVLQGLRHHLLGPLLHRTHHTVPECSNFMKILHYLFLFNLPCVLLACCDCRLVALCLRSGSHVVFMSVCMYSCHDWISMLCGSHYTLFLLVGVQDISFFKDVFIFICECMYVYIMYWGSEKGV